jgi:predicted nucleotidyltransferase
MEVGLLVSQLKKLNFPRGHYAVFGSAVLAIRGLREAPNIDVIVTNKLWDDLLVKNSPDNEGFIHIGSVKISNWWFAPTRKDLVLMIDEAEEIEGVPFVRMGEVLFYKSKLKSEKDINDVKLIEDYMVSNSNDVPINLGIETYREFLDLFISEVNRELGEKILSIIVFGSVSRGQAKGDSDIDLFVFYDDQKISRDGVNNFLNKIIINLRDSGAYKSLVGKRVYPEIYPFLISKKESDSVLWVFLDATEDGFLLKDVDGFGRGVMENAKNKIKDLGGRRVKLPSGGWCWMLFRDYSFINKSVNF